MLKYVITRIVLLFITLLIIMTVLHYILNIVMVMRFQRELLPHYLNNSFNYFLEYFKGIINNWDFGKSMRGEVIWPIFKRRAIYTVGINLIAWFFYTSI